MAQSRKDPKGRILKKGEIYRKNKDLYQYVYTNTYGKRVYLYDKDLYSLRDKERKAEQFTNQGLDFYLSGKATLDCLFERYMKIKRNLRRTTLSNYQFKYDHYVRKSIGRGKIGDFKYSDIYSFYLYLSKEKGYSLSTIEGVHSLMSALFKLAIRDNIIARNPTDSVWSEFKINSGLNDHKRISLTIEQEEAFIKELDKPINIRWRPLITVLLGTGCRISEVTGLRWVDIDLDKREIDINHTLNYFKDRVGINAQKWEVGPPKSDAGNRIIPMLDEVRDALLEEKAWQDKTGRHCTFEIDGMSGFLFCSKYQGPLSVSSLNKAIIRIIDDYNAEEEIRAAREHKEPVFIPRISCHNMRHTFATRLCENETNLKVIQSIMGHKDITTTMNIYADANEKKKGDSIRRLSTELHLFS